METKETYRINTINMVEINRVLQSLGNRLDSIEGRRGTPTFRSDVDVDENKITNLAEGTEDTDAVIKSQLDAVEASIDAGEGYILVNPWVNPTVVQGTWVTVAGAYLWGGYYQNTTAANADSYTFSLYLAAGTYTLIVYGYRTTSSGIVDFDVDGVEVASVDFYGTAAFNNRFTPVTGITITTSGNKTITVRVHGKNASSNSYYMVTHGIIFNRPA